MALKTFKANNNKSDGIDNIANKRIVKSSKNNKSKNLTYILNIRATKKLTFLIFNAKKVFNYLKQLFIKALIFRRFDLKSYVKIETDISGYAMNKVLTQLNLNSNILPNNLNLNNFDFG